MKNDCRPGFITSLGQVIIILSYSHKAHHQLLYFRVPLLVEMWNRDKQLSKDVFLGAARLPLSDIIVAEKTKIMVCSISFVDRNCTEKVY